MADKERAIGEVFEYRNMYLKVVEDTSYDHCLKCALGPEQNGDCIPTSVMVCDGKYLVNVNSLKTVNYFRKP